MSKSSMQSSKSMNLSKSKSGIIGVKRGADEIEKGGAKLKNGEKHQAANLAANAKKQSASSITTQQGSGKGGKKFEEEPPSKRIKADIPSHQYKPTPQLNSSAKLSQDKSVQKQNGKSTESGKRKVQESESEDEANEIEEYDEDLEIEMNEDEDEDEDEDHDMALLRLLRMMEEDEDEDGMMMGDEDEDVPLEDMKGNGDKDVEKSADEELEKKETTPKSQPEQGKKADASKDKASASIPTDINVVVDDDGKVEAPKTFKELGLCTVLCESVAKLGWKIPSAIQQQTLPIAFSNRDIIALAETGSGKTAAFALPILQALLIHPQPLFALVLAPTRELAFQISEQFEAIGGPIHLKCVTIVGGVDEMDQARALARQPHIVVATPGRIVHHVENTKGFSLRSLKFLVLDEADRLLNADFEREFNRLLEVIPRDRRTYLFSATMTSKVAKLQRASLVNPVKIEVSKKYQTARNLVQQYVFCPAKHKDVYLAYILNELAGNTAIIFAATCESTQRLAIMLRNLGFSALPLHGKLNQAQRLGALNKFKGGQRSILIATDVASRGLDIPAVDLVINYDVPTHSKDYVHRVGRTARAGRSGRAITIVTQYEIELYQRIEGLLGYKLDGFEVHKEAVLVLLERVTEANRLAIIELRDQEEDVKGKKRGGGDDDKGRGGRGGRGGGRKNFKR